MPDTSTQVLEAKSVVDNYKKTGLMCGSESEMRNYQRIYDAAIHPATGEVIPRPFRVSAIAPVNIPIVFAMLACPPSNVGGTLFLHWFNQSYNTACNYANRSGQEQSLEATAKAYSLAVASACGFAYGLGKIVEKGPPVLRSMGLIIPWFATAAANCSNIGFTRADEIVNGTEVKDGNGNVVGLSKIAGTHGVAQTAITRCVLVPSSCLFLPPLAMSALRASKLLPRSARGVMLIELSIIYLSLQMALPAALAVYPQVSMIVVSFHWIPFVYMDCFTLAKHM